MTAIASAVITDYPASVSDISDPTHPDYVPQPGTLDPDPGTPLKTITLDELLRGSRPLTVLERLERHALGREPMTPSEIQAGKIFLDKTVPTLKATEHTGEVKGSFVVTLSNDDAQI